eukprot:366281-Chlamydomonas_euryale.AAC.11
MASPRPVAAATVAPSRPRTARPPCGRPAARQPQRAVPQPPFAPRPAGRPRAAAVRGAEEQKGAAPPVAGVEGSPTSTSGSGGSGSGGHGSPLDAASGRSQTMAKIKAFGIAGTLSYVVTEVWRKAARVTGFPRQVVSARAPCIHMKFVPVVAHEQTCAMQAYSVRAHMCVCGITTLDGSASAS